jgi:hypothetical protein
MSKKTLQPKPGRVVVAVDTFSLSPINMKLLVDNYLSGAYTEFPSYMNLGTSKLKRKKITGKLLDETTGTSHSNQTDICITTSVTGEVTRTVTTHIKSFKGKAGGRCFYCRRKYQHEALGVCIHPKICYKGEFYYIVIDRNLCNPRCLLGHIETCKIPDCSEEKAMKYTIEMLRDCYGIEEVVKPAPNFRLLKENDGTEDFENWIDPLKEYEILAGRFITPSKFEFKVTDILQV